MGIHYGFDRDVAKRLGLNEAIILNGLAMWSDRHIRNGTNFVDGHTWVYNTIQAWADLYPFWSAATIRRTLKSLEDSGHIISGCYNKHKTDRTRWYALTEIGMNAAGITFAQNDKMQIANCTVASGQNGENFSSCEVPFGQNEQMYNNIYIANNSSTNIPVDTQYNTVLPSNNITPLTPQGEQVAGGEKNVKPNSESDERFNVFWQVYPKHVAKEQARKAFNKLNPNEELLGKMLGAIDKQKCSVQWQKDGGQYIPMPSTWLNQRRWEDEVILGNTADIGSEAARAFDMIDRLNAEEG